MHLDNTPKWHMNWRFIHTPLHEISLNMELTIVLFALLPLQILAIPVSSLSLCDLLISGMNSV